MKNIHARFGYIELGDWLGGKLRIVDKKTGGEYIFASADELIAAGWVVD
jgi:hypothetical protein